MAILLKVNGNDSGRDRLFASVAGRRFPARVSIANTGPAEAEVELQMQPGSGARVVIADPRLKIGPGETAETMIQAETPSLAEDDTVLQVLVAGVVEAEFRFTAVSLARESIFHGLVPRRPEKGRLV